MLIKSLLSYHHAFSPVNVAREQTTSLKTLLEVTSRSIKMFKLRSIQDTTSSLSLISLYFESKTLTRGYKQGGWHSNLTSSEAAKQQWAGVLPQTLRGPCHSNALQFPHLTSKTLLSLKDMNKEEEAAREAAKLAAEEEKLTSEAVTQFEVRVTKNCTWLSWFYNIFQFSMLYFPVLYNIVFFRKR